ncbi:MAG: threonine ammonia-lyase, biosynthetic [Hellea sp.]|nr:threonine ammonia-lyase, biosynthetic [Hellea sp.]
MSVNLSDLKARIEAADVYALAKRTPLELAKGLSAQLGRNVWLKREDLQDVFSFKIRGAANRISNLTDDEKARGVCAASAGNHAQGVAASAAHYGTKAVIFMPITTPPIKVEAVHARGGETRLVGDSYDAACDAALEYARKTGAVFVHPFDEIDVIAGQGTVGKEILEQMPRTPAAIYVCTGGGGLLSGIGTWVKSQSPNIKIIAVEPSGAATFKTSLEAGAPTALNEVDKFADGVAVKMIGSNTFDIASRVADLAITVSNDEICAAVKDVFEATRTVVEPAGALALAGLIAQVRDGTAPDGDCVVTISGANVNFDRIGHIVERAELGAGGEMLFAATIPERPGAFLNFCRALGSRAVTEFNYRFTESDAAHVLVGVKLSTMDERQQVLSDMQAEGIEVSDLSHDRLAKRHLRHMVGGRASADIPEVLYRFEFPERPGALTDFLINLDSRWNISLFHYRNHGSSEGHVLCGFQVPDDNADALHDQLSKIGYPMTLETDNIAYRYFLSG